MAVKATLVEALFSWLQNDVFRFVYWPLPKKKKKKKLFFLDNWKKLFNIKKYQSITYALREVKPLQFLLVYTPVLTKNCLYSIYSYKNNERETNSHNTNNKLKHIWWNHFSIQMLYWILLFSKIIDNSCPYKSHQYRFERFPSKNWYCPTKIKIPINSSSGDWGGDKNLLSYLLRKSTLKNKWSLHSS